MPIPLVTERVYDVPMETLWRALTDKDAISEWYFAQVQAFEPVVGSVFRFTDDGSAYQKEWKVTQVVVSQKLAHTWAYKGYPGCSEVAFELFPEGEKTRLTITHTGLESFPGDPHFASYRFEWGWQHIGDQLTDYLLK
ncbi:hypothetical protein GCM10027341_53190 [Spirosoma knui]